MMQHSKYILLLIVGIVICSTSIEYVQAKPGARWSQDLSSEQHKKAKAIMEEARPRIQALRSEVRAKLKALEEFYFEDAEDNQNLAKLGQELQSARDALRQEFINVDQRLMQEVGVSIGGYRGRNCAHLSNEAAQDNMPIYMHIDSVPHHGR